jgi:hypothetical protein
MANTDVPAGPMTLHPASVMIAPSNNPIDGASSTISIRLPTRSSTDVLPRKDEARAFVWFNYEGEVLPLVA